MKEVFVKVKGEHYLEKYFEGKDLVSIDDLLACIEDLYVDNGRLEEKLKDLRQDIEDNYKQIPYNEQVGVYDSDFI